MKAVKLQLATRTLLNPGAQQWSKVTAEEISLGGTPLHLQPSKYVRASWAGKSLGAVRLLKVRAAHNSKDIAFRLEWADETQDTDHGDGSAFPDGAGILFPLNGNAPLERMGSPEAPVNAWYWRANADEEAQNLIAKGPGTVEQAAKSALLARARWADGRWEVVLARPLAGKDGGVKLSPGESTNVAFAVWEGASQERAGIKAFSKQWRELEIA
jgi:DMSO reductase family type II enzyme heme b subunit